MFAKLKPEITQIPIILPASGCENESFDTVALHANLTADKYYSKASAKRALGHDLRRSSGLQVCQPAKRVAGTL